ncbi:winged helix DNA-binding domain-containing protein [Streptomyces sp. NPDC055287]
MTTAPPASPATRLLRARAQGVGSGWRGPSVAEVLGRAFALQAQDAAAAALGIRARSSGLTVADVVRATDVERSVVRNWFMRGTLHLVPAADVRWLTSLLGPVFLRLSARRYRELGLGERDLRRGEQVITSALGDGPLSRAELSGRLTGAGFATDGQVPVHLLRRCALLGLICHGPTAGGEPSFVLLDEWLGSAGTLDVAAEDAAVELVRRYRAAHGPATPEDFAAWSGLSVTVARRAWREAEAGSVSYEAAAEEEPAEAMGDVRLLPAYDNYLLGYRTRALSVPPDYERLVHPGGGQLRATVTVDGLACATWGRRAGQPVSVTPFDELPTQVRADLAAEEADVLRFLGER